MTLMQTFVKEMLFCYFHLPKVECDFQAFNLWRYFFLTAANCSLDIQSLIQKDVDEFKKITAIP